MTDSSCNLVVLNVVLSATGDDNFGNMVNALQAQGYDRNDRKYMVFMDANVYCGIGGIIGDDQAGAANANNGGPSYGRSDAGCWNGATAAHEHMHNLGGVQRSAPHSTYRQNPNHPNTWHCSDEWDVMCYADAPGVQITVVCPDNSHDQRFDCSHDDYYHTNPQADSYLATHWNAANSLYLIAGSPCANPSPGSDQIGLYEHADYCGSYRILGIGEYPNPGAMGFANDTASSIKVGSSVKAILCRDDNYGGGCEFLLGNDNDLINNSIGDNQVSSAKVESRQTGCNPTAEQVALFMDANYGGVCVLRGVGDYTNPVAIGLPNDSISSVKVGANVKATLCRDDNYGGVCELVTLDDNDLSNNSVGNDQVSSVKVEPVTGGCNPNAEQVALFVDPNYGGSCVLKGIGNYPNPGAIGLPNDSTSSIKVGGSVQATLCRDDNYGGGCELFTANDIDLSNNSIGDNQVSSVTVEARPTLPPPPSPLSPPGGSIIEEGQSIILTWSATGDQYFGEIWGGPGGTLTFGWQNETSKNIGSQWAGYVYSWRVKARNAAGESGWSSVSTFVVRPAPPSNLTAQVVSCSQINLYWSDNSGSEEGYRIYRNGSAVGQVGMNVTAFQNTGLSANTTYSYALRAYRGSIESNPSDTVTVSTPTCPPPQPDLIPAQWPDWQYPIVPSSITGTVVMSTLYAGRPTYLDWGVANFGSANAGGDSYGELYLDSTLLARYNFGNILAGWSWAFFDWPAPVVSAPGWHTLRVVADPDNLISESDEANNTWQGEFYWTASAPYFDNMESGVNGWTASGVWHQVGAASPYPNAYSPTHSWWYGQDSAGNYATGAANAGDLTSPSIYVPAGGYYLRFRYWYETETQALDWDQRWVQISVDGGPFDNVVQLSDDPMRQWLQSPVIDLSGYAGRAIRVRFRFDTIDGALNNYRGWYVDDFDISAAPPPSCADVHEPDNTPAQAVAVSYGQALNADICPGGDFDFYKFTGAAGDKVVVDIDARVNESLLDSYLFLLDSDGASVLALNDDEPTSRDSKLGYQLPHAGIYYLKVRAWNHPSAGGSSYFYTIRLLTDNISPSSAQITSPGNDAWIDPNQATVTALASDDESGVNRVEFLWHSADWQNSDWMWLGRDVNGGDGWSWNFDSSGLPDQRGGAFYIWAFDWSGNWTGGGVWNLGIDRTLPAASINVGQAYGNAPFRDFYVWWSGSDNLSGVATYDVQFRDGASGVWTNLLTNTPDTYYRFVGQNGHTYFFRVRARDFAGNQSPYTSGDTQHTVQICPVAADAYESDNAYASARYIETDGAWQTHNVHAEGDQDWIRFAALPGIQYTLVTTNTGGHADTILHLYAPDGMTLLALNDNDRDNWPASRLVWSPAAGGVYYVKVDHGDTYAYGCTTTYGLSITPNQAIRKVHLPIVMRNP